MNVQFPKLGLDFTVNRTAFTIGNFSIEWYGILIAVGVLLAFLYAMRSCKKFRVDQDRLIDAVLVGIIGGIIGARLYYVLFYPGDMYLKDPMKIFAIRDGGLGIYGGIIGGLLCGALMAKIRKIKVPAVLDLAAMGFLIGQCIGRWGNYVNQEAFGVETDLPWGMLSQNTQLVASGPVHPCFLYESLWCLLGFILLHIFSRKFRRYDGQVFICYIIWYGIGRFFIEGLRTDSLITPFFDLRVSQLVAALSVLAGIVLLIVFRNRTSLTGCGSKKVMELNGIVDVIPQVDINDGPSTIFGDLEVNLEEEDALAGEEDLEENSSEEAGDGGQENLIPSDEEAEKEASEPETAETPDGGEMDKDTEAAEDAESSDETEKSE